ncbi:hypothetical protein [Haloechinothrix salitolerans]|uniref:Uncharacterized protein n=1 Tax=Haloechinothrix salitolerans TaxID=926830 RepID=A0ABW2BX08_9PSEU
MSADIIAHEAPTSDNGAQDVPEQVRTEPQESLDELDHDGYLDADGRPFWLQEPCPAWCQRELHEGQHHVVDRAHRSTWDARLRLSLHSVDWKYYDASETVDGVAREYDYPVELLVHLEQNHREVGPRVIVEPELRHDEVGGLNLTLAEAVALRDALSTALELAEGGVR